MSRPGFEPGPPRLGGEHPRKKPFEQLVNSYSEHPTYEPATVALFLPCDRQVQHAVFIISVKTQSLAGGWGLGWGGGGGCKKK